jgi:hypothetical protein
MTQLIFNTNTTKVHVLGVTVQWRRTPETVENDNLSRKPMTQLIFNTNTTKVHVLGVTATPVWLYSYYGALYNQHHKQQIYNVKFGMTWKSEHPFIVNFYSVYFVFLFHLLDHLTNMTFIIFCPVNGYT